MVAKSVCIPHNIHKSMADKLEGAYGELINWSTCLLSTPSEANALAGLHEGLRRFMQVSDRCMDTEVDNASFMSNLHRSLCQIRQEKEIVVLARGNILRALDERHTIHIDVVLLELEEQEHVLSLQCGAADEDRAEQVRFEDIKLSVSADRLEQEIHDEVNSSSLYKKVGATSQPEDPLCRIIL
jgi:hypothetical protein